MCAAPVSLPFVSDLLTELSYAWRHQYSAHLDIHTLLANVEVLHEKGYEWIPRMERNLGNYLSPLTSSKIQESNY